MLHRITPAAAALAAVATAFLLYFLTCTRTLSCVARSSSLHRNRCFWLLTLSSALLFCVLANCTPCPACHPSLISIFARATPMDRALSSRPLICFYCSLLSSHTHIHLLLFHTHDADGGEPEEVCIMWESPKFARERGLEERLPDQGRSAKGGQQKAYKRAKRKTESARYFCITALQ